MSIDWSTAPEGATHWEPRSYDFAEGWMRKDWDGWSYWSEGGEVWVRGVLTCDVSAEREATFEARPQDTWDGQGLPPVGTLCEWHGPNSDGPDGWVYTESNVVAYTDDGLFICMQKPGCWPVVQRIDNCEFRPLRTPEQIAAEERDAGISDMQTITDGAGPTVYAKLSALYDAGYRRQEEGK
ncbi:hypothetical protein ACKWWR_006181 [Pseudomonas aeruginosa]|uniref:hypothetical protein n=1 Tax=Pseudomonas aeruginosa TaxID=287 RepID=UPI000D8B4F5F|nr:hypothetical protein [Pseudomonas aeruginosa]EKT8085991.1 hypothetical protein [Pseudomonas aeruginosa]EKT8462519.1 hypothetical protein [Pseudomonas aeruginosa]EKU0567248.1 hypothetical protein [Pseudomonas aeruginosa]EKV9104538.1 hypothetical protein [Pseudomonas aeruginosa]EKW6414121.1 hypothetical protein [Pseudomonas aeruginosa]